jgi:hypothetical protein
MMFIHILLYLCIFITLILFFYIINILLKNNIKIEKFNENNIISNDIEIYYIKKQDLINILKKNNDNYYNTFFKNDYITRNIDTIEDYYNNIDKSVIDINNNDKIKLNKCIYKANNNLKKINLKWFNGNKASKIPWKIGCINNKLYENGLPHTRNDIIILSKYHIEKYSEYKLTKTLIHEKVHVYQKIYPNDCKIYLDNNGFIKFKKRSNEDNIRANPDLDNWIYKDMYNNIYQAKYNNNPLSVEDITYLPINTQSHEHPFEKMAIDIENSKL